MAHIVMPTWNALSYTEKCIKSLVKSLRSQDTFVIVDNGSEKDTVKYLKSLEREFRNQKFTFKVLYNDKNLGYVKAINRGIEYRKDISQDVILLNNDLDMFPDDWVSKFEKKAYELDHCGILGVKQIKYIDNIPIIMHYGAFTLPSMQGWPLHGGEEDIGQCSDDRVVDHVNFAMVLIKSDVINTLYEQHRYYLCPQFESYCEDDDYCLRAKLNGYLTYVTSEVTVVHHTNISTIENKVSQSDLHKKSIEVYKNKWSSYYEKNYEMELNFHSLACFPTGYATAGRKIIRNLDDLGIKVNYSFLYGTKYAEPSCDDIKVESIRQSRVMKTGGIQLLLGQGDVSNKNSGDYKIAYTMLETDSLPGEWVDQLNSNDEVWVPSNFNKETFQKAGVAKPILVMPLGIDSVYFNPSIKPFYSKFSMPVNFLSVGEWGERKNFLMLIHAFKVGFKEKKYRENAGLTVRYTNNDYALRPMVFEQIKSLPPVNNPPHVKLVKNDVQDTKLNQQIESYKMGCLYKMADVFVLPTSGEGFGLPPLEALACGLPVIVTGWSSYVEYLSDDNGDPLPGVHFVDYDLETPKAKCPYYEKDHKWAKPNINDLIAKMRYVCDNIAEEKKKALETSKIIREKYSWKNVCLKMKNRLLEIKNAI